MSSMTKYILTFAVALVIGCWLVVGSLVKHEVDTFKTEIASVR